MMNGRERIVSYAGWCVVAFLLLSGVQTNPQTTTYQPGASAQSPLYIRLVGAGGSLQDPFYANVALPSHASPRHPLYLNTAIVGAKSTSLPIKVEGLVSTDVRGGVTVFTP